MIKTADRRAFAAMSALGQKQTCAAQTAMSALPLKADISECARLFADLNTAAEFAADH